VALWNGKDPILKERLFGLTNNEAITVKMRRSITSTSTAPQAFLHEYLYKYPQHAFPYCDLVETNKRRNRDAEYELLDTGVFNEDRYFDVFVE
jgi:hypothetical protein